MNDFVEMYLWAALGVAISVVLPVVTRALSTALPNTTAGLVQVDGKDTYKSSVWRFTKPYLLVAIFSLLTALIIVAFVNFDDFKAALVGGYAWDATLQKIRRGAGA